MRRNTALNAGICEDRGKLLNPVIVWRRWSPFVQAQSNSGHKRGQTVTFFGEKVFSIRSLEAGAIPKNFLTAEI
jgi:hypothetical protein